MVNVAPCSKLWVLQAGGWKYPVFTGRRDGYESDAKMVDLPPPSISWDDALSYFKSRGLDVLDLGTLLGSMVDLPPPFSSSSSSCWSSKLLYLQVLTPWE